MPAFPSINLLPSLFKIRKEEPLFSEADNIKFLPIPKGIYRGFTVTKNDNIITISPGSDNMNLAVIETDTMFSLTFSSIDTYNLDFTGHTTFPVWIVLEAHYDPSLPTTGSIITTSTPLSSHVKICKVDSGLTISIVENVDRDIGLLPGNIVNDISAVGNIGSSSRFARQDHTHKGVHRILAGTGISISGDGFGDVTINTSLGPTVVNNVQITSVYRDSVSLRQGAPMAFFHSTWSGNIGVVGVSQSMLSATPCIGLLVNDNPAQNTVVSVIVNGEAVVKSSVFTISPSSTDIGKPVIVAPAGATVGKLAVSVTAPTSGNVQRVGMVKEILANGDVIVLVHISPDVFTDLGV